MAKLVKKEIEKDKEEKKELTRKMFIELYDDIMNNSVDGCITIKYFPVEGEQGSRNLITSSLKFEENVLNEMKLHKEKLLEEIDIKEKFIKQQRLSFKKGDTRFVVVKSKFCEEPKKMPGVV